MTEFAFQVEDLGPLFYHTNALEPRTFIFGLIARLGQDLRNFTQALL
jgi:hypothetical protein